jgi:hypothetical protein
MPQKVSLHLATSDSRYVLWIQTLPFVTQLAAHVLTIL